MARKRNEVRDERKKRGVWKFQPRQCFWDGSGDNRMRKLEGKREALSH